MARAAKATTVVDEIQNYLNGVAKSLVDRLYGPNGPAWGTRLSELEATVVAIRQHLSERMLHDVLQRQAATVDERPEAFRACPLVWPGRGTRPSAGPSPEHGLSAAGPTPPRYPWGRGSVARAGMLLPQMSAVFFSLSPRVWALNRLPP